MTAPVGRARADADVNALELARLVAACPAVAALSAGPIGVVATHLPGARVSGVRIEPNRVEVHVVATWDNGVEVLDGQVRAALAGRTGGRRVDIVVEDVEDVEAIEIRRA